MNRRNFIAQSAAVTGLSWARFSDCEAMTDWASLDMVVFDDRFAAPCAFAAQVALHGANLRNIAGDITQLWYDDLFHRWSQDETHIAGFTLESSATQLAQFARDRGYELRRIDSSSSDGSGFGRSIATELISESGLPIRLISWTISQPAGYVPRWT